MPESHEDLKYWLFFSYSLPDASWRQCRLGMGKLTLCTASLLTTGRSNSGPGFSGVLIHYPMYSDQPLNINDIYPKWGALCLYSVKEETEALAFHFVC